MSLCPVFLRKREGEEKEEKERREEKKRGEAGRKQGRRKEAGRGGREGRREGKKDGLAFFPEGQRVARMTHRPVTVLSRQALGIFQGRPPESRSFLTSTHSIHPARPYWVRTMYKAPC